MSLVEEPRKWNIQLSSDKAKASIWRTDSHRDLVMKLPRAHEHLVEQCTKPSSSLSGRDAETAAAKEYPAQLSFAMTATLLTSLKRRIEQEGMIECTVNLLSEEDGWIRAIEQASKNVELWRLFA